MPPSNRARQREMAKLAMTAALAVTVFTAPSLHRNRSLKTLHTAAGLMLVGCSLWHHQLYQRTRSGASPKKREISPPGQQPILSPAGPTAENPAP
ncbi:MAG: hypothetical protein ACOX5Z_09690 [Desulfobulbus sp.]|jgi:hypothetical protein